MLREAHAHVTARLVRGFGVRFCFQWVARWAACCTRRARVSPPCRCGFWVEGFSLYRASPPCWRGPAASGRYTGLLVNSKYGCNRMSIIR